MIESLIDLFNQLDATQEQETINSSWEQLNILYKNKSIIQPLMQIYDDSTNPFYTLQAIQGIRSCLVQSFIHFNQTELYSISSKIIDMYLNEQEDYFKILMSEMICYLINQTQQTWPDLNHLIFHCQPSHTNYFQILFHYSIIFPNSDLILLKVQQSFDFDLKTQLQGFHILLHFAEDIRKIYELFSNKIQEMVNLIFMSNDIYCFNIFCKIYEKYFSKVYPFCNIFILISNLSNEELNPSILISLRDFLNSNFSRMIEYQYQIDIKDVEDKEQYYFDAISEIFNQEISLSIYLFSIEIDEMTTTSETFLKLVSSLPQEMVESTIYELAESNDKSSILTSIPLFSAFIQNFGVSEERYDFFTTFLNTSEIDISFIAIDTLYELKKYFKKYFQPPLIEFLMNFINELRTEEELQHLTHQTLILLTKFVQEFDDISPLLAKLFDFGIKIITDGKESEIKDVLLLFNFCISLFSKKDDEFSEFYIQLIQIILELIDQSTNEEILYISYSILSSFLFVDKSILEPFMNSILNNLNNVYSLKFVSASLAFFGEKVSGAVEENIQKIVEICDGEVDDCVKTLTAMETEITIFSYFKAKIDLVQSIFNLLFLLIQNMTDEIDQPVKAVLTTFLNDLRAYEKDFNPNSISPFMVKLLGESFGADKLVLDIVLMIIGIYGDPSIFDISEYFEYIFGQTLKIFQSGKANSCESILVTFCDFLENAIEFSDDEVLEKVLNIAFTFLNNNDQAVKVVCLRLILICEPKIDLSNEGELIENIIGFINEEETENNLDNEIACNAARFVKFIVLNNQELTSNFCQLIIESTLKKLENCEDNELAENLAFILINLDPFYFENEELDATISQSILNCFPIRVDHSLFECCYDWLIKKLEVFPEEAKLIAFQSIVRFIVYDIRQFFEEENLSGQSLEALFTIVLSLPNQLISESLDNDQNLLAVFSSHMKYISSVLKKS